MVHLRDVGVVLTLDVIGEVGIERFEFGIGFDGIMRLVGPNGEEEGLGGNALLFEPGDGLGDDERRGVALHLADGLTVANEVAGVLVGGASVVLRGHPPVVAVVARLWLGGVVEEAVEMPFAAVAGGVARFL